MTYGRGIAGFYANHRLWVFARELALDSNGEVSTKHDTTMTFTTFVLYDFFNALTCRSDVAIVGSARVPLFANTAFVVR